MTDYRAFYSNQSSSDPTRTLTLRDRWSRDFERRLALLAAVVQKAVVDYDCFGLDTERTPFSHADLEPPKKWEYRWSKDKVGDFMKWLDEMEERSILEIVHRPGTLTPEGEPWTNMYVRSAYQRGLEFARQNVNRLSRKTMQEMNLSEAGLSPSFLPTGSFVSAVMQQPFHAERLALAYTRVFNDLKGIDQYLDTQISRVLTRGIAEGLNPREMGKILAEGNPDLHIGSPFKNARTRGVLMARTETINIHQNAAANEYERIERQTGEIILIQWKATHDSRVRDTHLERDMRVYTRPEAIALSGEPNCRCALLPYIPAIQGMPAKVTDAARKLCMEALPESETPEEKKARLALEAANKDNVGRRFLEDADKLKYMEYKERYSSWIDRHLKTMPGWGKYKTGNLLRGFNVSKGIRDLFDGEMSSVVEAIGSWQGSAQGIGPISMKLASHYMETGDVDNVLSRRMIYRRSEGVDRVNSLNRIGKEVYKDKTLSHHGEFVKRDEYIRFRAFNQAYMESRGVQEITLYRGTDGRTGPTIREEIKGFLRESKDYYDMTEAPLVGYSRLKGIADVFGIKEKGVTVKLKDVKIADIFAHEDLIRGITGRYESEHEYIIQSGLRRIPISDIDRGRR